MNSQLEEVVVLAYKEIPPMLSFINRLVRLVKGFSKGLGRNCDVKKVSSGHLGLYDEEDFFMIRKNNQWVLVTEISDNYVIGTEKIPNAIYIEHEGRYAFVVGDFSNISSSNSKEVPPL